jgi:beta-glucosidase
MESSMFDVHQIPAFSFPPGFLLGSGAASYQIEGGNHHSYLWRDELAGKYWIDNPAITHPSGATIDFRNRWQSDIDLIAALGHRAWRLSLEWSRIEPSEGVFDETEIDWYRQVLERLAAHGIKIFLTLSHISLPAWFEQRGGIGNPANIPYFEKYAAKVVPRLADLVDWWNVLNEFNGCLLYTSDAADDM